MRAYLAAAALLLGISASARAQLAQKDSGPAAFDFRGHRFGDLMWSDLKLECLPVSNPGPGEACYQRGAIGNVSVKIYYWFQHKMFKGLNITFASSDYTQMVAAYRAKFGDPDSTLLEALENRMGGRFTSQLTVWHIGPDRLTISEHGSSADTGEVAILAADAREQIRIDTDSAGQRARKDL